MNEEKQFLLFAREHEENTLENRRGDRETNTERTLYVPYVFRNPLKFREAGGAKQNGNSTTKTPVDKLEWKSPNFVVFIRFFARKYGFPIAVLVNLRNASFSHSYQVSVFKRFIGKLVFRAKHNL
ncbi:hypothetical protein [Agrobacterium burrii]